MGIIENIFIAAEKGARVEELTSVEAIAGSGLKGDRYSKAKNRKDPGRQVTLIEAEQIERFISETGLPMALDAPGRNLVTRGIALNELVGKRFQVGECELEGVELCEPCAVWAKRTHREVVRFFVHRGGLGAMIVEGGEIIVGSTIVVRA